MGFFSLGRDISAETVSYQQLYNKGKILGSHVGQSRLKISGEDDKNWGGGLSNRETEWGMLLKQMLVSMCEKYFLIFYIRICINKLANEKTQGNSEREKSIFCMCTISRLGKKREEVGKRARIKIVQSYRSLLQPPGGVISLWQLGCDLAHQGEYSLSAYVPSEICESWDIGRLCTYDLCRGSVKYRCQTIWPSILQKLKN